MVPIVKITVQGMEHAICHAMTEHFAKLDAECQKVIKQAVESFDYQGEVRRIVTEVMGKSLRSAIEREFYYGGQGYKAIEKMAQELGRKAFERIATEE